jgi:CheY-like chemotaxis protein
MTGFRAQTHLEGKRPIDAVVAPWDVSHALGGEVYRWVLANRADLRNRFVFIADEVPPEYDAVVGGRCLAVPLSAIDEIVRVAGAIVRRVRTPPLGIPIVRDNSKPTLLLVDDDPALLDAMTHLLIERGYAVTQTESGNQATSILEHAEFDAILTDWHMHDGSGADLYNWILDHKPALAARVVFLSEADQDDSGPIAPGRPMFRKGQDSQALVDVLKEIVTLVRGE